ncbi:MAG TPA: hypothetical protein VKD69_16305 [Vicinamibacterales bacterium]|nr:hypothetical protein [Vicinamibacterales bacterium]
MENDPMANFQKNGQNVNGKVLTAAAGQPYELGLWGPLDTRTTPPTELAVSLSPPNASVRIERAGMLAGQNVLVWRFHNLPVGRALVEAKDRGGAVWTSVTIETSAGGGGTKYTNDPNEVPTRTTTPSIRDVHSMVRLAWSQLNDAGARTLTAQFMAETGGGKYCFNWNLGNVKAGAGEPHMYLRNVWEVVSPSAAQQHVAGAGGLAHIATDAEIRQHGWSHPGGTAVVVFQPPHAQCRFRAYTSLQDGAQRWMRHHQAIAARDATYLPALNAADIAAVAHALKQAGYYTAGEADYARAMTAKKADVDRTLGAP